MQLDAREYEKQWPGLPIKYLVLSTNDYIIFLDEENDLDWNTTDDFERIVKEKPQGEFNFIRNEIASLESIPCSDLDEKIVINFKRQLGEALVRDFEFDFINAKVMLSNAKQFIIARNSEKSRYLYLKASGLFTFISLLIIIVSWLLRYEVIYLVGDNAFYLGLSFFVGSLGAFISIILRMGKTNIDYNASKKLHYMEGSSKIVAGMISGLIIAFCIKIGIFLPALNSVKTTHIVLILGALLGGASERLAPSIIKKIEISKKGKSEKESNNNNQPR